MEVNNKKTIVAIVIVMIIGIVSFTILGNHYSNPENYKEIINTLDQKSENVLAMGTSSAAISTGLTMLPGDVADPMANELADLSSTMMLILCAIYLEKYLLTLAGVVTFKVLIPVACLFMIGYICKRREALKVIASKLVVLGLCLVLLVPASTAATNFIEKTYDVSIENNLQDAEALNDKLSKNTNTDENIVSKWLKTVKGGIDGILEDVETVLKNFIEMTALMIVTSCIIPILTLIILIWLLNMILGTNIPINKIKGFTRSGSKLRNNLIKKKAS